MAIPRLAEVRCERIKFDPGDRILVRTTHRLSPEQTTRLRKTIQKWAGCELEILIYSLADMDLRIEKINDKSELRIGN